MVPAGVELRSAQLAAALYVHAGLILGDRHAHLAQIRGHCCDAVRLLDAQLARIPYAQPVFGNRSEHREHGDLVDDRGRGGP